MKQISTGTGLCVLGLGIAVLGAAQMIGSRGNQAFAQSTGVRRIVSASVLSVNPGKWGYRIWSDNVIEMKCFGYLNTITTNGIYSDVDYRPIDSNAPFANWTQVDNGLTAFVPADVDTNGSVDSADLGKVLLNYGETQNGNPPPPIDCTINAPR